MVHEAFCRFILFAEMAAPEFSTSTLIMAVAAFLIFITVFYYIFHRLREESKEDAFMGPHALLTQFRDMKDEGELSPEEYRNIKLLLADKIAGEALEKVSDKSK